MERGGDLVVHHRTVQTVPDHVPADVAAEHPDAASVVARRPSRPITVRVVDRGRPRSRAGLVLAMAACALVAAFVGGGAEPQDQVQVRATTPPAATTVTSAPAAPSSCPAGSSVVLRCEPTCSPPPFGSPFGICRPASPGE
jgi:hypothetical protein